MRGEIQSTDDSKNGADDRIVNDLVKVFPRPGVQKMQTRSLHKEEGKRGKKIDPLKTGKSAMSVQ